MAIDFKAIDKRKLIGGVLALGAALIAMVLANSYIETNLIARTKAAIGKTGGLSEAQTQQFLQRVETLERANQELVNQQNMLAQAQAAAAQQQQQPQQQPLPLKPLPPIAVKTPAGKRAMTVMIEKLNAVGGLVSPGDYVDVIVHLDTPTAGLTPSSTDQNNLTVTLFQNILVLAVAENVQPGMSLESVQTATSVPITLALNPQEASLVSFAQKHGTLQLVLRSPLDSQAYILPIANWNSLSEYIMTTQGQDSGLGEKKAKKMPEPPVDRTPIIEVFRGGQ